MAADQQAPCPQLGRPQAWSILFVIGGLEIGELAISPVVKSRTLGAIARRQTLPRVRTEVAGDLVGAAGNGGLAKPRPEVMVGSDPENIALSGSTQALLDVADTVD